MLSHVRIARRGTVLHPVRIEWRQADLMLACDGVVSVLPDAIGTIARDRTRVVLNRHAAPLAEFTRNSEAVVPMTEIVEKLQAAAGEGGSRSSTHMRLRLLFLATVLAVTFSFSAIAGNVGKFPCLSTH